MRAVLRARARHAAVAEVSLIMRNVKVVDLFCGIGGLTHGLKRQGLSVTAGVDLDASCRYAYEANNDGVFLERDIAKLKGEELAPYFEGADVKVLVGCAPCQPFSTHSQKRGGAIEGDARYRLLDEFARLVREVQPDIVSMENVPKLSKLSDSGEVLGDFQVGKCTGDYLRQHASQR